MNTTTWPETPAERQARIAKVRARREAQKR